MYSWMLHAHTILRYIVLIMLVIVIVKSLMGWLGQKSYTKIDNKLSLYLLIFTHIQMVIGLVLYFNSPFVQFTSETMKNSDLRYWTVEHITGMLIAIVLITVARSTSKRMISEVAKHKRLAIFNIIALIIIVAVIYMSKRGIIQPL